MSQAVTKSTHKRDFWWGLGVKAESQSVVLGVSAMMARMAEFANTGTSCVIRVTSVQVGPGLGGGGDVMLVIATGVPSPASFPMAKADGGWTVSVRDVVAVNSTPESCFRLARMIKTVPSAEIIDFAIKHPSYFAKLHDAVGSFFDTISVSLDALTSVPKLWLFPLAGVGFELGLTYQFGGRTELVSI